MSRFGRGAACLIMQGGGHKKRPLPGLAGAWRMMKKKGYPQEPDSQEPALHPPPPTGLVEVMEKPER